MSCAGNGTRHFAPQVQPAESTVAGKATLLIDGSGMIRPGREHRFFYISQEGKKDEEDAYDAFPDDEDAWDDY